jgi:translation initiation factor 5B
VTSNIIYRLLDGFKDWKNEVMEQVKREKLKQVTLPGKFQVMGDFIFRKSKPAVVGVHVLSGSLKPGASVMKENGEVIGKVKQLQDQGITVQTARINSKVACSIDDATYEKDFIDNEVLYTHIPEKDFLKIKKGLKSFLTKDEILLMKEIIAIQRRKNPLWGLG